MLSDANLDLPPPPRARAWKEVLVQQPGIDAKAVSGAASFMCAVVAHSPSEARPRVRI